VVGTEPQKRGGAPYLVANSGVVEVPCGPPGDSVGLPCGLGVVRGWRVEEGGWGEGR
jgi:hypothetical protein